MTDIAPIIIGIAQLAAGWLIKRYKTEVSRAIPPINYVLALAGYALVPKEASAGLWDVLATGGNIFVQALYQTVAVTGLHSVSKNSVKPLVFNIIAKAFNK